MGQEHADSDVADTGVAPGPSSGAVPGVSFPVRLIAVLLSAWMIGASTFPYGWWFLHAFAAIPLLMVLPGARRPWAWLLLYGTVAEAHIFVWIQQTIALFSNIPSIGAWAILILFSVVYGLPLVVTAALAHPLRRRLGTAWVLAWPAAWVLVEWLSQYAILFPYPQGATQHRALWLWQLASVTGTWGLSFGIAATTAVLTELGLRWREGRDRPWWILGVHVAITAAIAGWGAWRHNALVAAEDASEALRVAQLQSQHGMEWRRTHRAREAFGLWVDLTRRLEDAPVDLVVWPEGAVPYDLNGSLVGPAMWDLARGGGFDLVVGSGTREREVDPAMGETEVRVFNSVYVFDRARLDPLEDETTPVQTLAVLAASGCDLDAGHVVTPWEVVGLRAVAGDEESCREALDARAAQWSDPKVPDAVLTQAATRLPWGVLRRLTASFDAPMVERRAHRDSAFVYHQLDEAGCDDGDCRSLVVRCDRAAEGACDVVPEAPHYDKLVPLPFGEYLPFRTVFPWLADLIRGPGNFRAGDTPVVFEVQGVRFATPICYEGILAYVCRRFDSPDLLINVTNDAWFGTGAASDLHGMLVTARAMEMGVPVFRSTYTGVGFVALPSGRVLHRTPLFEDVARVVEVPRATVSTLYATWGDWFVAGCALMLGGLWLRPRSAP